MRIKGHKVWRTCFVILLCLVRLSYQASPVLTIPTGSTVVSLPENTVKQKQLASGITCSDADGDATRVYFRSINPTVPCGNCFPVWPCNECAGSDYCLMFTPIQGGSLNYRAAASYVVTLGCSDDTNTDVKIIDVRVEANVPPTFNSPASPYETYMSRATAGKRSGDTIYDVDAIDNDGDAIFYSMTTVPDYGFFEIGYGNGEIRAATDLRLLCEDSVDFYVTAVDSQDNSVGPVVLDVDLKGANVRPVIENTETEIEVPEDTAANSALLLISVNDDTLYNTARYTLRAQPERGLEYYYLSVQGGKARIRTRKQLDYEYADLRTVTLFVDVSDGFCDASAYSVTMKITDVNEPPVLLPGDVERTVYEGFIEVDPGWRVVDPDEDENIQWKLTSDGGGAFFVNSNSGTGLLHSTGEFDVDTNTVKKTRTLAVKVTDKEGVTDRATFRLTILDKNDNPPVFIKPLYEFTASNCTKVGALVGKINARDDDSEFQGNNQLVYSGAGQIVSVLSTGDVTLTRQCVPGETESIQGSVTDQGIYPGPLQGVPTTIQFSCNVCPDPIPGDTTTTVNTTDVQDPNEADPLGLNLAWILLAALLAAVLAALLAYQIWTCCCRAIERRRARLAARRTSATPKRVKSQSDDQQKTSDPKAKSDPDLDSDSVGGQQIPLPPELPPPEGEPFFFGFWKETYVDRDQRHMPQRDVAPATVEQDKEVEEKEKKEEEKEKEVRREERRQVEEQHRQQLEIYQQQVNALANPPPPSLPPPAPAKKKFCHIL